MVEYHTAHALPPADARYDEGLRRYMLGIYRNMGLGLALTGIVSLGVASSPPLVALIFGTPLKWVAMLAPLAFVMVLSWRFDRMSVSALTGTFFAFAGVMGVSMASIFLVFTGASIAAAFLTAAALFAGMSLWGYTTGRDLSRMSTFLTIGLVGVIGASLVNLLIGSSTLQLVVSVVGVVVFTGLTAWDTQRLKSEYDAYAGHAAAEKLAIMGALSLYLNIVNLFQLLLGLMGQRRE